jgi:hypothetical protein
MIVNWLTAAGTAAGICIFLGPFAYKERRNKGGSRFRAGLDVGLLFVLLLLWIVGGSNALYGLGYVIVEPPDILGSGGLDVGQSHFGHIRLSNLFLGLALMVAGWLLGRLSERRA